MESLSVRTTQKVGFVPISRDVQEIIQKAGIAEGAVLLYVPHTTAGVLINEGYDPDVMRDLEAALDRAVPSDVPYLHGEGNSPAHVKSVLVGQQVMVPVTDGRIGLGQWQEIFFAEFDGPRSRTLYVKQLG